MYVGLYKYVCVCAFVCVSICACVHTYDYMYLFTNVNFCLFQLSSFHLSLSPPQNAAKQTAAASVHLISAANTAGKSNSNSVSQQHLHFECKVLSPDFYSSSFVTN